MPISVTEILPMYTVPYKNSIGRFLASVSAANISSLGLGLCFDH